MSESDTGNAGGIPRDTQGSDAETQPPRGQGEERQLDAAEKVGRGLGKAFKMFKKTRVYQRNARAFREGMEDKE